MNRVLLQTFSLAALAGLSVSSAPTQAQITFIGTGSISGTASDLSGLTGTISDGSVSIPQNQLGAFGSGITYTGFENVYAAVNDRGYGNGVTTPDYQDRYHLIRIDVTPGATTGTGAVSPSLLATRLFTTETGQNLVGQSSAFSGSNLRFDPEAIRVGKDGTLFVSDEYGPNIYQFDQSGKRIATISVPGKYGIANPSADGTQELSGNTMGRQSNRGMEGLAISPDGTKLFGIMQNPLIQDGALNSSLSRRGLYTRILEVDLATGATHEYIYQLDNGKNNGVNEIVAVNDHQFLVIERDGNGGTSAAVKNIELIDLTGATDISVAGAGYDYTGTTTSNGLPQSGALAAGVHAVTKSPFINLLDPAFGLAGASFPEKIEGLAFGPDFSDGSHLLLVTNDNDLIPSQSNNFYAFRIGAGSLPDYQAQTFTTPFAVPEPGSVAFVAGLAITGLGLFARRKRK